MLFFGYCGESGQLPAQGGFFMGLLCWGFILYEIFMGEAGNVSASLWAFTGANISGGGEKVNRHVQQSFATMRFIVTIGWSIYPAGYLFGYLMQRVDTSTLNLVYNLADFINKIAFCL